MFFLRPPPAAWPPDFASPPPRLALYGSLVARFKPQRMQQRVEKSTQLVAAIPATPWPEKIWVLFLSFPEISSWWWITMKSNKISRIKLWNFRLSKLSISILANILWIGARCSYKSWSLGSLLHFDINFVAVRGGLWRRHYGLVITDLTEIPSRKFIIYIVLTVDLTPVTKVSDGVKLEWPKWHFGNLSDQSV